MSYTDVFGGATLYPAGQTYLAISFSADVQLAWPVEQAIAGQNVVANIMDLDATAPGLNVDLPDARQVSEGIQSVFNNVGANTLTIRDATGGTIVSLPSGSAWVVYLTDNSTEAGTWRIFQLGASVSVTNAAALAGAGLKAITTTLNQRIAPTSTGASPVNWTDANRAQLTIWTGGLGTLNLPNPGTVGSDWFAMVRNGGSGDLTITPPSGTIDDAATLALAPGQSATIVTDGTNFVTVGLGQSTAGFFDFIEINVAGSGDFTLSGVQLNRISYRFTGALTGNRNIIVPNTVQQYWVDNSTTGAFSLFVKTAAQVTPVEVLQGARNITYCDGTDVLQAESSTIGFPISIVQGGTGATDAATALSNLGGAPETRNLNTNALSGLAGGGDLTMDRDLELDVDNLTAETTIDPVDDTIPFYDDDAAAMRKTAIENIQAVPRNDLKTRNLDSSVANDTTVNTDGVLSGWSLTSNLVYLIDGLLVFNQVSSTPGIKLRFDTGFNTVINASHILLWWQNLSNANVATSFPDQDISLTNVAGSRVGIAVKGRIWMSGAATFNLQWAQVVSDANPTEILRGSYLNIIDINLVGTQNDSVFVS